MKNLEDLYKEILADQELKAQCGEAIKAQKLEEFLKAQGCEATPEEVKEFLENQKEASAEVLDSVSGGIDDISGFKMVRESDRISVPARRC